MRRSLFIAFVAGVVGGCYLRPAPPPGFRYSCDADDDCQALDCGGKAISLAAAAELIEGCDSAEVQANPALGVAYRQSCRGGLCEYPCGLLTYQQDCPTTEGFAFCFNGACASLCGTDDFNKYKGYESNDDFCTEPQTCIPLGPDGIDPALLGSSGGGGGSSNLAEGAGFCGQRCDAKDAPPCPAGQYCTGALCVPGCDNPEATPCDDGEVCIALAGYSSCLVTCDPNKPGSCGAGNVCVTGLNICQPTCVGEGAIECSDGFACDPDLEICLPISFDTDGGSSSSTT
jgi:hypothetical protein